MSETDLPAACRKVAQAAASLGAAIDIRVMGESTRTAEDAARAVGCDVNQIVKSLVFAMEEEIVLFLVAGANRLNEKHVSRALGGKLQRADANRVREVTGFAIGGIPPLGHDVKLRTFMDETLLGHDRVWAAAGTPVSVFSIEPARLRELTSATLMSVT